MFIKMLLSTHLLLAAQTLIQHKETYYQLTSWFSTVVTESLCIDYKILDIEDYKMEFVESQSQRINIRVDGTPKKDHETWSSAIDVKHLLEEKLDLGFEPGIEIWSKAKIMERRLLQATFNTFLPQCGNFYPKRKD